MILFEYVNRVLAWHESRDRGASAVEYTLILGMIVALVVGGIFFVGGKADKLMQDMCTALDSSKTC
jgi:Flp pilus assembly pilin Flp